MQQNQKKTKDSCNSMLCSQRCWGVVSFVDYNEIDLFYVVKGKQLKCGIVDSSTVILADFHLFICVDEYAHFHLYFSE